MKSNTFVLTGITGHLGRHVFFEIIKDHMSDLDALKIFILGRSSKENSLSKRIEDILTTDGKDYLMLDSESMRKVKSFNATNVSYLDINLSGDELIGTDALAKLTNVQIDHFLHIAAATSFRTDDKTVQRLHATNVMGTSKILELVSKLEVKEFSYVSTAYACGKTYGAIEPDYTNMDQEFRNPYEKSKLEGELLVHEFAKKTGIRYRIFRPSTISGRLLEQKKGAINKFDVFYGWVAYFLKWKLPKLQNVENLYTEEIASDIRIAINKNAGINIVPVDFAAKVLYNVCKHNIAGQNFHLVGEEETPHEYFLTNLLKDIAVTDFSFVKAIPTDPNPFEQHYYATVGAIFTGYLVQDPIYFKTDNLQDLYKKLNLECPKINDENLAHLVSYAKSKNFGIKLAVPETA
ncbi:SDR family oxidoreductase [Aquimarina sp. W85]|uniref:SDR family oxidoreductase n=1 Tax=Aquimarina rhodophyticola TaxID=3342246 RepID=UPI0036715FE5